VDPSEPGASGIGDNDVRVGPPGRPRWVKVSLLVALAIIVLFVVLQLVGGGDHGPGRHTGGDDPPSSVNEGDGGHRPPVDHGP
jgi:hypothetical protein